MNGAIVLMYHRVCDVRVDPWELAVRPEHFAEHLDVIARTATARPLASLASSWQRMFAPGRSLAITFDDGYVDNYRHARPLLERFALPATIFVVSGAMGGTRGFWWDTLADLLFSPGRLPSSLDVRVAGTDVSADLGNAEWTASDVARHRGWSMLHPPPTPRHSAYATVWRLLQATGADEQARVLGAVAEWAGRDADASDDARAMTPGEVAELAAGGLIEIGAHTVTHPMLAAMTSAAQDAEIGRSRTALEAVVARPVTAFSYPFGSHDAITQDIVRRSGFSCACTTQPGTATRRVSRFAIPRFHVRDVPGDAFERQLTSWLTHQG